MVCGGLWADPYECECPANDEVGEVPPAGEALGIGAKR